MDIVSKALALPIPLTKEYVLSLPRIPKDFKVPKRVCRDVKLDPKASAAEKAKLNTNSSFTKMCKNDVNNAANEQALNDMIPLVVLLLLCCCCISCMLSIGTGGYAIWKRRNSKK